jgi:hypothetical protein
VAYEMKPQTFFKAHFCFDQKSVDERGTTRYSVS